LRLFSEAFDLLQMVDVVASHGLDQRPEGHGATLGVGRRMVTVFFGDRGEQPKVPVAGGPEEGQCGVEIVGGVARGPGLLIEGADERMFLAEGLAQAKAEDEFAVGKVGDDLADAPLPRSGGTVDLRAGERGGERGEVVGGGNKNGNWFLTGQEFLVGVQLHGETVSRRYGRSLAKNAEILRKNAWHLMSVAA
jgi:hypothetical protein